jgi:hypothetical protein
MPGRYNSIDFAHASLGGSRYGFGTSMRDIAVKGSPGPGSYEQVTTLGTNKGVPVYSMPGRRKDLRPKTGVGVPGAAAYQPSDSTKPHNPTWTFGTEQRPADTRSSSVETNPGAGKYHIDESMSLTKLKSAQWR